jgi:ketosteroid isomerase-like protein
MTSGNSQDGKVADLSDSQLADRVAIRSLIDAYAYCADRRDATGQMALFTEDTDFVVYMDSRSPSPTRHLRGRAALARVFDELNTYEATMHFNGQNTVELDGDRATGVTYCVAYHVKADGAGRSLMTAAIRYLDSFVRRDSTWLFDQRKLIVVWTETRPLASA